MKLKRLIIHGFKSFKDRTTIHFDDGITGIVGPNGCGKSNIVDALFWVMGEQSAKHLRGNSMKDVIFSGSSKFSPGAWAEATLVLENTNGKHIHIGNKVSSPSEIQLTRKLYRNGDTEYRINGNPCRLKDIQEVFMDTGAGAKSYSIIAQGEINRLVQAKPVERRTMIEEVAGITKFKIRKKESVKKIEQTQSNLARLNDLQVEIEKNLKALEKQAEKAERARSLKEKIKRNELIVNSHKVFDTLKAFRETTNFINEKTISVADWKTRKDSLEVNLEDERIRREEQTEKVDEFQKEYNELSKELAAAEERLTHLAKSQTEKEALCERSQKEIEELKLELESREEKLTELLKKKEELNDQKNEGFDFSDLEEEVENLKSSLEDKKEQISDLKEEFESLSSSKTSIDQEIFKNNSKLEEYAGSLQDITTEIEALENQYSGVSKAIADEREAMLDAERKESELIEKEVNLKESVLESKSEIVGIENIAKEKSIELIQSESKLNSLIEINNSLEGGKAGAIEFLSEIESDNFQLLGSLLKCDEKYTKGVQALLTDLMNSIVSTAGNEDIFTWIENNSGKGIELLVSEGNGVSEETLERLRVNGLSDIITLKDIITLPEEFSGKLDGILGHYLLTENLSKENYNSLSSEINFKAISSFDGSKIVKNLGGGKTYTVMAPLEEGQGVVARNNLIQELTEKVELLKVESQKSKESYESKREALISLEENYEELRNALADARADYAAKKSALDGKLSGIESGQTRLDILKNRKNEVSKNRLELIEAEESLSRKFSEITEKYESIQERLDELTDEYEVQNDQYEDRRQEFVQKEAEAKNFDSLVKTVLDQVDDLTLEIEKRKGRIDKNTEHVETYLSEIEEIENILTELEDGNQEKASNLQEKEDVLHMMKDELVELLQQMQERENEVKELTTNINKTEKELVVSCEKIEQYKIDEEHQVRNTFEKYQIDLRDSLGKFLEFTEEDYEELIDVSSMYFMETESGPVEIEKTPYEFVRKYGQDLKERVSKLKSYKTEYARLGDINWQAIEDYDRQKLRFQFLKVQEEELRKSLVDLETAINHIDEKSKERFKAAYHEVGTRFEKVFPIIFGGGNAKLEIQGSLDDPDCGIDIIASPPGKKMQNINLMSGGEKAMTAVSLIFSIFLVKPSPFCLLDEVDAPLDDANVGRFNELLREMSEESQFILITHNKKTMELNDTLYGVTMQEPGVSKALSVQLH